MDITDVDGMWRITENQIENRKTGEIRRVDLSKVSHRFVGMNYDRFMREIRIAFETGVYPGTKECPCCGQIMN